MSLTIKSDSKEFEALPEGQHLGVCYKIIDQGSRNETYPRDAEPNSDNTKKRKTLSVTWEIPEQKMSDGRPMSISKTYTASLNENATLYKDLVTWRGKSFSKEELDGFDLDKMIGAPANLEIEHNANGNARVKAIFKPDEFKKTETVNAGIIFDLDVYCEEFSGDSTEQTKAMCDIYDGLPEWQQNLIEESFELKGAKESGSTFETSEPAKSGLADLAKDEPVKTVSDEDIPF